MKIKRVSPFTRKETIMDLKVTKEQLISWEKGELAQNAFPDLSIEEREFIISGITPKEWEERFG